MNRASRHTLVPRHPERQEADPHAPRDGSDSAVGATGLRVDRHLVGLEPRNAWRLKGLGEDADEIVIPGILLDDTGGSQRVEAVLDFATFCQLQAMAAIAELRMLEARARATPERTRPEANLWTVEGVLADKRLDVMAVVGLDRVVFWADRQVRTASMTQAEIVPGQRAWR